MWTTFAEVDAENESLAAELDRLDDQFKRAGKQQKVIEAVRDWGEHDVNWLDELRDLSLRFPSGRDAVLLRMGLSHARARRHDIDMVGVVRDPVIVSRIENSLRDKYHQISSRHVQERMQDKSYSWHFESSLIVAQRDKQILRQPSCRQARIDRRAGRNFAGRAKKLCRRGPRPTNGEPVNKREDDPGCRRGHNRRALWRALALSGGLRGTACKSGGPTQVRLRDDIAKRELDLAKFRKASQESKSWQTQSLPSDTGSRPQLVPGVAGRAGRRRGLSNPNVDSGEPVSRKGMYNSLSFSVRRRGTLKQLTKFLFDFYRADHLHQIQSLSLTPVPRLEELEIAISIEALSLASGSQGSTSDSRFPIAWHRPALPTIRPSSSAICLASAAAAPTKPTSPT